MTVLRFAAVSEQSRKSAPLEDLEMRAGEKVLLATRAPMLRGFSALIGQQAGEVALLFERHLDEGKAQGRARVRYAALLLATGKTGEAQKQLERAGTSRLSGALRAAYGLQADPARHAAEESLRQELDGWLLDAALASLYRREGRTPEAAAAAARIDAAAEGAARGLTIMGALLTVDLVMGLGIVLWWGMAGRFRNLRSTDAEVEPRWDPVHGWSLAVAWQLVSTSVTVAASPLIPPGYRTPFTLVVMQGLVYAIVLAFVHRLAGGQWREVGVHGSRWMRNILVGIGGLWAAVVVILSAALLMARFLGRSGPSSNPVFQILKELQGPQDFLMMFLLVAVLGPLFEEILFRGVIYQSMRRVMPVAAAIPLSAAAFSLAHGDVNGVIPLLALGCLLAYVFERTRSVVASTVTHCLWNGQVFVATIFLFS